jgi:hypothetical protein
LILLGSLRFLTRDAVQTRSCGAAEANRKLIEIFEEKIQVKLAEIWGEGDSGWAQG